MGFSPSASSASSARLNRQILNVEPDTTSSRDSGGGGFMRRYYHRALQGKITIYFFVIQILLRI